MLVINPINNYQYTLSLMSTHPLLNAVYVAALGKTEFQKTPQRSSEWFTSISVQAQPEHQSELPETEPLSPEGTHPLENGGLPRARRAFDMEKMLFLLCY